ncbi:MAG: hypothetical protein AB7O67_18395 [Vicinamibacterales bacterium]
MTDTSTTHRREFLNQIIGATTAAGLALSAARASAATVVSTQDWTQQVQGRHRALFDFPQHKGGVPLLHILNYLGTQAAAFKTGPGEVGAVGTFYSVGPTSSIPLAFNDHIWAKYELGAYTGLEDASGKPYTRNVFRQPTAADAHLLIQAMSLPTLAMLQGAMPALGIESLQKMGTTFLICNNALGLWTLELEAKGRGTAAAIDADLRANLLPGVTIVPAMVIAIDQAQKAGITYNRQ